MIDVKIIKLLLAMATRASLSTASDANKVDTSIATWLRQNNLQVQAGNSWHEVDVWLKNEGMAIQPNYQATVSWKNS